LIFLESSIYYGAASNIIHPLAPDDPLLAEMTWLRNILTALELPGTAMSAERVLFCLQKQTYAREMRENIRAFTQRVVDDFKGKLLLAIDPVHASYYERKYTLLGKEAVNKLSDIPGLTEDAAEAGNCFSLERYTACIFHLMRVMERCVQKMGNDLGLPEKITCEKDWGYILCNIRGPVKKFHPNEKDEMRIRYEAVIASLDTVRIVWRNPTMHPKATYTEGEAEKIIRAVQAFVEDFLALSGFFSLWFFFKLFPFPR
jgi:hypothetical protein